MKKVQNRRPERHKSFGTIALIEGDSEGELLINCDVTETEGVDSSLINKLKESITGLAYLYENDGKRIADIGKAYLKGIDTGIRYAKQQAKAAKVASGKPKEEDSKVGFRAKIE